MSTSTASSSCPCTSGACLAYVRGNRAIGMVSFLASPQYGGEGGRSKRVAAHLHRLIQLPAYLGRLPGLLWGGGRGQG